MEQQFLNQYHSATFGSPATPPRQEEERGVEMVANKGWSSERVALSKNSKRCSRHVAASSTVALFPFSSGRTMPSKWDDAERWISSPVFGQEGNQSERRAKSKSGPLGPQMLGNYSPVMPVVFGAMTPDSPLLGPSKSNNSSYGGYGGGRRNSCPGNEQDLASTREWLKLLHEPPGTESQDERSGGVEEDNQVTRVASRRDMGTQMLPSSSSSSSETEEMVKDVKVDKEDTLPIRRSLTQFPNSDNDRVSQSRLPTSTKLHSEEAARNRIDDWETLQKEKAEAAIQKLEMKLEKKRSSSIEKIMKKLKRAELKAEMMRSTLSKTESHGGRKQVGTKTRQRIVGLYRRIRMPCIANCLSCR